MNSISSAKLPHTSRKLIDMIDEVKQIYNINEIVKIIFILSLN